MTHGNTREAVKNHFQYRIWVYLLIGLVGWFVADLAYTMTEYRPPAERKVEFQLVQGGYADGDALSAAAGVRALADGQAYDATLEEVSFYTISYSGDATEDVYGAQKYVVMVAAQEGDIWILPRVLFEQLHAQGALMALDELVDEGLLNVEGLDLSGYTLPEPSQETDSEGQPLPPAGDTHLYGLPASRLKGLAEVGYIEQDACVALMGYSKNPKTCAVVLDSVMRQLRDGLPAKEETA